MLSSGSVNPLRRSRGLLLALLLTSGVVAARSVQYRDEIQRSSRYELATFDPYVYLAMAEHPAFFTIPPWGYRILTPFLAHALPLPPLRAYRYLCFVNLALSGGLLFLWLRRLGHGEAPSLLAVVALAASAPVAEVVRAPVMAEPASLALALAFLVGLEAGAPLTLLASILVLGALGKEIFVLFAPLAYLTRHQRLGKGRALLAAALVGLAPLAATATLRLWWTPGPATPHPPLTLELLRHALLTLFGPAWSETWPALVLAGLTPLALLGALRKAARPFLARYGYLALATYLLPLGAWLYVPGTQPVVLLGGNALRLMIYALPFLLALALYALDRLWRRGGPWQAPVAPGKVATVLGAIALVASLGFPFVALDRYRRVEFRHVRDGPLVLALTRQSLKTARWLEEGRTVTWDLAQLGWLPDGDPRGLPRMRWFLREGWGPELHYGTGEVFLAQAKATLLVPLFEPADVEVSLALAGAEGQPLEIAVNGTPIGRIRLAAEVREFKLTLPAARLFRGDNRLSLARLDMSGAAPRLERIGLRLPDRRPDLSRPPGSG